MSSYLSPRHRASQRPSTFWLRAVLAVALVSLISACGGGEGDGADSDRAQSANSNDLDVASAQALAPASALQSGAGWVMVPAVSPGVVSHGASVPPEGGQVYYVDSKSTSSASVGTLESPWKTLKEVQDRWSSFQDGDAILLKCGSIWRETLQIGKTDASRPNLLIGAYGQCSDNKRPVIRGSALVDKSKGWQLQGHVYVKTLTLPPSVVTPVPTNAETNEQFPRVCDHTPSPQPIARLFLAGQPLTQARFPNKEDNAGSEFVPLENDKDAQGNTIPNVMSFRMRSAEMSRLGLNSAQAPDLLNAIVHIRTEPWEIETRVIKAFDATTGKVTLDRPTKHAIKDGSGYILEGKAWLLQKEGQWAYEGGKLYWWPPASLAPKNVTGALEASHIEAGILANQVNGLKIERIRFEHHRRTGVDFMGDAFTDSGTGKQIILPSKNITLTDVQSMHSQGCGLSSVLGDNVTVQDSKVIGAARYGIHLNPTTNAKVLRNLVTDTGLNNQAGGSASGVTVRSFTKDFPLNGRVSVSRVEENQVLRSANTGIFFSNDVGTTVHRNTVIQPCVRLTDCGGIYSFTQHEKKADPAQELQNINDELLLQEHGATVSSNLVVGAISNLDGSFTPAGQQARAGQDQAVGIYLDELSTRTKVIGNTVANTEVGIYLHLARFNTIDGNTVVNVSHASFMAAQGANVNGYRENTIQGNRVVNNRFFSQRGVDASLLPKTDRTYYDYDAKPVYAQLWQSTQVSAQTFFTNENGPANVSSGNVAYTTSNVKDKTWRTDRANLLSARHGGVWGVRQNKAAVTIEQLNLSAWQQKSGAVSESETSPLAFKKFLLAQPQAASLIQNGNFDLDTSFWYQNNTFLVPAATFTQVTAAPCSPTVPCGRSEAYRIDDFLSSNKFSVTANDLYLLSYTLKAGPDGALHRANVRKNGATGSYDALGFNFLNQVELAPNQEIRVEQFFRASASSTNDAVLSLRATDGSSNSLKKREIFVSKVSLTPIGATDMPIIRDQAKEVVTLVNASDSPVTRTCSNWQLDGMNSCNLIDGTSREVIGPSTRITVPPRSTRLFFFNKPEWVDN